MARIALLLHLLRTRRREMAAGALQFAVCAEQWKVRIARMVEHPQRPAVRRMARPALLAQAAFVHIVGGVATIAISRGSGELHRGVTLHATDEPMQTQQRELRQVVIELEPRTPIVLAMTSGAFACDLVGVRILTGVAAFAILGQFLRCIGDVAGMAIELGVRTQQRKAMAAGMIAETPGMGVVGTMTAVAILGDLFLIVPASVAGQTVHIGVRSEQCVAGLLQVIVLRALPLLGGMALAAFRTARAAMFIVGRMAPDAGYWRGLVAPPDMAGIACGAQVSAAQMELSLIMIELAAGPAE